MKVRLTRKLSELIDGVDLRKAHTGDTLDLSDRDARTLVAEGWAEYEGGAPAQDRAHDKPSARRTPRKAR